MLNHIADSAVPDSMPFSYNDEQQAFISSVTDVFRRHCTMDFVRRVRDGDARWEELWERLVDLDLLAVLIPDTFGGLGLSPVEVAAILEVAGRFAPPVPLSMTAGAFAPMVVTAARDGDEASDLLAKVLDGAPCTVAPTLDCSRATTAQGAVLDGRRLTARCDAIPDAGRARLVAVPAARTDDGRFVLVVGSPEHLGVRPEAAMDPTTEVGVLDVAAHDIGDSVILEGDPRPALPVAWIAAAAELVGLATELLDRSVEHARSRVQFSRPIGSFQAVKHRLVDTLLAVERARSLTRYAALRVTEDREDAVRAGHRAKAAASEAASMAARTAVQVHGGIGITAEHDVSLLYLRARQLSMLLGGPDEHYACACLA
jgi:alkylation response protein AidB-like acyl-CoA dehydrogenase